MQELKILRSPTVGSPLEFKLHVRAFDEGVAFRDISGKSHIVYTNGNIKFVSNDYKHSWSEARTTNITESLTARLTETLNNSEERSERSRFVSNVKADVIQRMNAYVLDQNKADVAAQYGLSSSEWKNISTSEAAKIAQWLNSGTLHFGQSAFFVLGKSFGSKRN
jgi:hypothetical protein